MLRYENLKRGKNIMVKVIVLLLVFLLALAAVAGYFFLDKKITDGEMSVAGGKLQIEEGKVALEEGKARLEAGKLELAAGKNKYEKASDNAFLVWADKWLNSGKGFEKGREQIADGDKKVARGEEKVSAGEKRLDAGEVQLSEGMEQLEFARRLRVACEIAAVFFIILMVALVFRWRR
jgi:hypothetical protein